MSFCMQLVIVGQGLLQGTFWGESDRELAGVKWAGNFGKLIAKSNAVYTVNFPNSSTISLLPFQCLGVLGHYL